MTANELVNACDISFSTLYRKLDLLTEISLVKQEIVIRTDGQNTTRFVRTFEQLRIEVDADLQMDVLVDSNAGRLLPIGQSVEYTLLQNRLIHLGGKR